MLPCCVKVIEEICGKPIPYDVDWEILADEAAWLNFLDNLSCHHLNMALRTICIDDMGKVRTRWLAADPSEERGLLAGHQRHDP